MKRWVRIYITGVHNAPKVERLVNRKLLILTSFFTHFLYAATILKAIFHTILGVGGFMNVLGKITM